jgi:hypothetical protein
MLGVFNMIIDNLIAQGKAKPMIVCPAERVLE